MADETNSLVKEVGDILCGLVSSQGTAYRQYGEAVERYGSGQISASELFKIAGDLYLREAGRVTSSLFDAGAKAFNWALAGAGVQVTRPASGNKRAANPKSAT